jgi:voltage-gated potassium channel
MAEEVRREPDPRAVRTVKPGDRVLRVRTRRARLPLIEREVTGRAAGVFVFLVDLATQTPVLWMIAALAVLVALAPIPVYLFERGAEDAQMTSYWVGLWWAVSAFSTAGHSDIDVFTVGGRIVGSIYTIASVGLFFGSVIAAFSSYFILTWRRPKRQLVDTINYYLQRIEELSVEELEDLDDMTRGLLQTARERAEMKERHSPPLTDEPAPSVPE